MDSTIGFLSSIIVAVAALLIFFLGYKQSKQPILVVVRSENSQNNPGNPGFEKREREIERLRQRIIELEKENSRLRHLLSESSSMNDMLNGLWNAYKNDLLRKCYQDNGSVRVLADGTVICEKIGKEDEGYVLWPRATSN